MVLSLVDLKMVFFLIPRAPPCVAEECVGDDALASPALHQADAVERLPVDVDLPAHVPPEGVPVLLLRPV